MTNPLNLQRGFLIERKNVVDDLGSESYSSFYFVEMASGAFFNADVSRLLLNLAISYINNEDYFYQDVKFAGAAV